MKHFLKGIVEIKEAGAFSVIASTAAVDRQGEVIDQAGWDLTNYKANPVMLWAHRYDQLPLGVAEEISVVGGNLVCKGRFASAEANPMAEQVRQLYADGILNAVSVGFIPKERNGNIITKAELLEISFVPVPANPQALSLAMSKGFDLALIKDIEEQVVEDAVVEELVVEPKVEEKAAPDCTDHGMVLKYCQKCVDNMPKKEGESEEEKTVKQKLEDIDAKLAVLAAKAAPSEGGTKTDAVDLVVIPRVVLEELRGQLRVNDKHNELSIAVVNRVLGRN